MKLLAKIAQLVVSSIDSRAASTIFGRLHPLKMVRIDPPENSERYRGVDEGSYDVVW